MQSGVVRFTLVAFLLVLGLGAGWVTWEYRQDAETLASEERDLQVAISKLAAAVWAVGSAQEAYLAPGQAREPWFERTSLLAQQIYDDLAALEPLTRSPEAPEYLSSLGARANALLATDASVRELLRRGQDVMAADVVLGDGRATVDEMAAELYALAAYEGVTVADMRRAGSRSSGLMLGAVSVVWAMALFWLAVGGRSQAGVLVGEPSIEHAERSRDFLDSSVGSRAAVQRLDIGRATSVSSDVARARSADELGELLGRASDVLNSPGAVLWIGAGDLLYPAASSGFDKDALHEFGPLDRSIHNATVDAWNSGTVHTVPRTKSANGAIVAPLFGDECCIGVLALEVRDGRESDTAVQAAAAMFAAQFSGIMPKWAPTAAGPAGAETSPFELDAIDNVSGADLTVESDTSAEEHLDAAVNS